MKNITWILSPKEADFFKTVDSERKKSGRPFVIWGWKRDKVVGGKRQPESRTVYFSADLKPDKNKLTVSRGYFFLQSRAKKKEIDILAKAVRGSNFSVWPDKQREGYSTIRLEAGTASSYDKKTVARRLLGKPRIHIDPVSLTRVSQNYNLKKYLPFCIYAGSGLSAESGLPLLGAIHSVFYVDNLEKNKLIFGSCDPLPGKVSRDPEKMFAEFCRFNVDALKAKPSESHLLLQNLWKKGLVKQVFTDNVDDIFAKVGIPVVQARVSIFPDRFKVSFAKEVKSLLVVGISVDRRQVVSQARRRGLKIIAINPVYRVAPYSRNIDYLYKGDIFYKGKAKEVLPRIIKESGMMSLRGTQ